MTYIEAAESLGISLSTLKRLVKRRALPVTKVSPRRCTINEEAIVKYKQRRTLNAK
jgi:excisionase family DNA binding protein